MVVAGEPRACKTGRDALQTSGVFAASTARAKRNDPIAGCGNRVVARNEEGLLEDLCTRRTFVYSVRKKSLGPLSV